MPNVLRIFDDETPVIHLWLYSGNRLRSTPRDRKKVLTLSEVDLIRIQRHIVKYSQVFNLLSRFIVTVNRRLSIRAVSPVSVGLLFCRPT